ncbi:MAG TPA: two-component system sensor histidine kinase CreC [Bdellovibrionales bacterium]|nr:two-component system sensor histidine kinase CreC [Bdellovibrionales bacterium]
MSLRLRLILGMTFIILAALAAAVHSLRKEIRPRYKEVVEDSLVELSQTLAAAIARHNERLEPSKLDELFKAVKGPIQADIFGVKKTAVDFEAYVTDAKGTVVYDSAEPGRAGQDFSKWNDVHLTLQGKYGSRSTRRNPDDELSSLLHVAAPILVGAQLAGVVSVRKPERALEAFLVRTESTTVAFAIVIFGFVLGAAVLLSTILTRPIGALTRYALLNRGEGRHPLPPLSSPEFRQLGQAFEEMRVAVEGKRTIENYVQAFTHELKSPLTAIRAASELALEEMPPADRARFLANIQTETRRIQMIVDYLLEIASLESRTGLKNTESVDLVALAKEAAAALEPLAQKKNLRLRVADLKGTAVIEGEKFLLFQALRNLVQNAIEHAKDGTEIAIATESSDKGWTASVTNEGDEIPEYALPRIFEKFYSLEKPDSKKKSSGLGLPFAKEVAALHRGSLTVVNRMGGTPGVTSRLTLPANS